MIYDKRAAANLIGCLMVKPQLLNNIDKYVFDKNDFALPLHKVVFSSIYNLYYGGAEKLSINDIHDYLSKYPELYSTFTSHKGSDFLLVAEDGAEVENFDLYYDRVKKLSLLRTLKERGFDISDWYVEDIYDISKRQMLEKKLEEATLGKIIMSIQGKLAEVESDFTNKKSFAYGKAADGLSELIEDLKKTPEIGLPLQGKIFNTLARGARRGKMFLYSGATGEGKALPNDTSIPTPSGWKTVGEIKAGDLLFDRLGNPTKVVRIFPQGDKEVYKITFSDGREALCNDEHLWTVYTRRKDNFKTVSTREMIDQGLKNQKSWKYKVPLNQPIKHPTKILPIDPYVFGLILGDGSFREQPSNKSFSFSSEDSILPSYIAERMNWSYHRNSIHNFTWTFKDESGNKVYVSDLLKDLPDLINLYSEDKFIPETYLTSSIDQRFDLLNGLLDSDGTISQQKAVISYATISEKLKENVVELVRSLGFIASVKEDRRADKYKKTGVCYSISIQGNLENKSKLFKLPRKIERFKAYAERKVSRRQNNSLSIVSIEKMNYTTPMTCFEVDNSEHLFLMNDYIVTHNTRIAIGNAAYLAYPVRWNIRHGKWENVGSNQKVLYISTEQQLDEIQTILLAYVTGINEEKILNGDYTEAEQKRVVEGKAIMKKYEDNFHIYLMPDPSIEQLNSNVRRMVINKEIDSLFYDYIHTSTSLITEFSGARIREDVALLLVSNALKNLANELNIFVWTSTQYNAQGMDADFVDEGCLRGSRAIADKVDLGAGLKFANKKVLKQISHLLKSGLSQPNMYIDIYKNRRSRYKRCRLWMDVDLGCSRVEDILLTDEHGNDLPLDILYAADATAKCNIDDVINPCETTEAPVVTKLYNMNNISL